jgi:hypothetical protein
MVDFAKLNRLNAAKTAAVRRVLICGDRKWTNYERILTCVQKAHKTDPIGIIIEGECDGADVMGRIAGDFLDIPVWRFPADWEKYCNAAGPIRNQQMLTEGKPTEVWAFHKDITLQTSRGTHDMVMRACRAYLKTWVLSETAWRALHIEKDLVAKLQPTLL